LRRDPATGPHAGGAGWFIAEVIEDHILETLRAAFDIMFRRVLKTTEEWAAANPGLLQCH
jgi:hypothetical protein